MKLHLDFETRSTVDIKSAGLDNYARHAEILMLAWAIDDGEVNLWVPVESEPRPTTLMVALVRSDVVKVAWNAAFERAIFLKCLGLDIPAEQWLDPKMMARYASIASSLDQAGQIMGLSEDEAKLKDGRRLIQKFCKLHRGVYKQPKDHPEDWEKFKEYCRRDVVAERLLLHKLQPFCLPESEEKIRLLDSKINEAGLPVDVDFVTSNKFAVAQEKADLMEEMKQLTGLDNPNSPAQLLPWLKSNGYPYSSLTKKHVALALEGV
jgi:DNA polymerase bacteriophage-type